LIEEQVFKNPAFIKHVPMDQRPDYIIGMLHSEGAKYIATDYTAFESLFVEELMFACEMQLYRFMVGALPEGRGWMRLVEDVIGGVNVCRFRTFICSLMAKRMSGEMCTSLGNGFSNLMFMLFLAQRKGCTQVKGVVEGDDGLFTMVGTPPTVEDFAELGLVIKADVHIRLETASFCGMVFDLEDRRIITDPRKVMATFGWTSKQYARCRPRKLAGLLRCKALSLAYQYPGCPVIAALARYGMRATNYVARSIHWKKLLQRKGMDSYQRERLIEAIRHPIINCEVGGNSRLLVEELYGIDVATQLKIEAYLDSLKEITPLADESILGVMPEIWKQNFQAFAFVEDRLSTNLFWPVCMGRGTSPSLMETKIQSRDGGWFAPSKKIWAPFARTKGNNSSW